MRFFKVNYGSKATIRFCACETSAVRKPVFNLGEGDLILLLYKKQIERSSACCIYNFKDSKIGWIYNWRLLDYFKELT